MKPVIFIHTPSPSSIPARVCAYSLRAQSNHRDSFDVRFLSLEDAPELVRHSGETFCWRDGGRPSRWDADMPQAFVFLRRKVPELMNFEARALLIDPDIVARGDVWDLLSRDMQGKALFCRPRPQAGEGFHTSVMLMDCSKLRHWQWRQEIEEVFRHERAARGWFNLTREDPATIGFLEIEWNDFDRLNERTRLLHYTDRRTQPWLTGLPYAGHYVRPNSLFHKAISFFRLAGLHRPHPHADLFLRFLHETIEQGGITEAEINEQIRQAALRRDILSASARARDSGRESGCPAVTG